MSFLLGGGAEHLDLLLGGQAGSDGGSGLGSGGLLVDRHVAGDRAVDAEVLIRNVGTGSRTVRLAQKGLSLGPGRERAGVVEIVARGEGALAGGDVGQVIGAGRRRRRGRHVGDAGDAGRGVLGIEAEAEANIVIAGRGLARSRADAGLVMAPGLERVHHCVLWILMDGRG